MGDFFFFFVWGTTLGFLDFFFFFIEESCPSIEERGPEFKRQNKSAVLRDTDLEKKLTQCCETWSLLAKRCIQVYKLA